MWTVRSEALRGGQEHLLPLMGCSGKEYICFVSCSELVNEPGKLGSRCLWLCEFVCEGKSRGIHFSSAGWGDASNTGEFTLSTENVSVKDALFAQWQLHVSPCEASQCSLSTRRSGDHSRVPWIRYKDPEYMTLCINKYWLQKNKNLRKVFINFSHRLHHLSPLPAMRKPFPAPGPWYSSPFPIQLPPQDSPSHSLSNPQHRQDFTQTGILSHVPLVLSS